MEIYFKRIDSREEAEKMMSQISGSVKMSIGHGYPGDHGGLFLNAPNGYIALTSGGVLYGFIDRSVGDRIQTCAILGYYRSGSLINACVRNDWKKTTCFDWLIPFSNGISGVIVNIDGHLRSPSHYDQNKSI